MRDHLRKIGFAGAAVVLLASTVSLALREPTPRNDAHPPRPAHITAIRTGPPPMDPNETRSSREANSRASTASTTTPPHGATARGEREPKDAPAVAPSPARAATARVRAFLRGYLPYSYGRAEAKQIRAAARSLLHELESSPPRVPATVAGGDPRLISVRAQAATGDLGINVLAVVDDGQRRYSIPLAVRHAGHRWIVTAVRG